MKHNNIDLQNSYIDIVSSVRDLPPENVEKMLKAKEELNKSRHIKLKIKGNKKTNYKEIK